MGDIINKGAKYIGLFKDNHTILVDMRDILDILPTQFILQNGIPIYDIIFQDGLRWQLSIDNETLKIWTKYKNKLDKKK
ncbi:MAG: hypothetical protein IKC22_01595 [Bacilli bacterium]|uniref:hypothetical protein n=1 Tax=Ralstonia pseudosolanacearum TaxID=1310165 RepID=UPI003D182E91|nr:hypothetical protein [bacterium]MBR2891054.1 hypothetical protein [Bacilli bacterium]MBR4003285.1 hypothetical protein [Clostridia bacterium]